MMDVWALLLIAVGLAMDSFSVSITSGLSLKSPRIRDGLKIGAFFGFFQAFMPILGWLGALTLIDLISDYDHWAAFFMLLLIGFKMIRESAAGEKGGLRINMLTWLVMLGLSVATSIDALAVGATLAFLHVKILTPVVLFGVVTFLLSFAGMYLGNRIGKILGRKIEGLGGALLILIAVMILLEHLL